MIAKLCYVILNTNKVGAQRTSASCLEIILCGLQLDVTPESVLEPVYLGQTPSTQKQWGSYTVYFKEVNNIDTCSRINLVLEL